MRSRFRSQDSAWFERSKHGRAAFWKLSVELPPRLPILQRRVNRNTPDVQQHQVYFLNMSSDAARYADDVVRLPARQPRRTAERYRRGAPLFCGCEAAEHIL